jgi:hypothetical protein
MANPYTTVTTYLVSVWEGGVITQPTFFNKKVQNYRPPNAVGFEFGDATMTDANPGDTEHFRPWDFVMEVSANSDPNRELIVEQLTKWLRAYDNPSRKYKVSLYGDPRERKGIFQADLTAVDQNFITTGAF